MAKKMMSGNTNIGYLAFLVGVIIAVIAGLAAAVPSLLDVNTAGAVAVVLVLLGIVVGLLNLLDKDVTTFLIAAIAITAAGGINTAFVSLGQIGTAIQMIVSNLGLFVAPAAVIIAVKSIWDLSTS
ncbi:MAG: hypothetical protein V1911_03050 [Candidatus Micrarchaeota archaeon]